MAEFPDADSPVLYETAQFTAPRIAFDALDVATILREATAAGVHRPRLEQNTRGAGAGKVRITCRVGIALRLVDAWTRLGERAPLNEYGAQLATGVGVAVAAALEAIDAAITPRPHAPLPRSP